MSHPSLEIDARATRSHTQICPTTTTIFFPRLGGELLDRVAILSHNSQPCVFDLSNCHLRSISRSNSADLEVSIDIGYIRRTKLSLDLSVAVAWQGKLFLTVSSFDIQIPNRPHQLVTSQFPGCHPLRQALHLTWRNSSSRSRVSHLKHPWTVSCRMSCHVESTDLGLTF